MTDGISKARQALRDYARTAHEIELSTQPGWVSAPVGAMVGVVRGEAAGKAFMAAQEALTVAEELREESKGWVEGTSPDEAFAWRQAQEQIADRIEAAVLKVFS